MYFLVLEFPYEGCGLQPYRTQKEAEEAYEAGLGNLAEDYVQGIAIIEGKLLKSKGTLVDLDKVE